MNIFKIGGLSGGEALLWVLCITVTVWMQRDIRLVALGHCMYANDLESLWGLAACQRGMKL